MDCTHCGAKNNDSVKYCKRCLRRLDKTDATSKSDLMRSNLPHKPKKRNDIVIPSKGISRIIVVILFAGVIALGTIPSRTLTCSKQTPYTEQVSYQEQEAYQEPAPYEVSSKTCTKGLKTVFDVYAFSRVFVINEHDQVGQFSVTLTFSTAKRGRTSYTQTQNIQPSGSAEFNFETDVDVDEDVYCDVTVQPPTITKYRTVTKYRTETRYRTETYTKEVRGIFSSC